MSEDLSYLEVHPGDEITLEREDDLLAEIKERTAVGGLNTRVVRMGTRQIVHFDPPMPSWNHSWKATLQGTRLGMRTGLINGYEPQIDGVPLGGDARNRPPTLALSLDKYDDEGRSWIALQVTRMGDAPEAIDKIDPKTLTIVQLKAIPGLSGSGSADVDGKGYCALAVLKRRADQTRSYGQVHQIRFRDLSHRYSVASKRHFFPTDL
jgi:hypothetical protein